MKYLTALIALVFFLGSCSNNKANSDTYDPPGGNTSNSNSSLGIPSRFVNNTPERNAEIQDYSDDSEKTEEYPDDTYCAEVEFYNPDTGTRSGYTLTVEVEDNEVTRINFPNGGGRSISCRMIE
ncbi:hypothetical protein [Chitinophaga polysaccharea]|uniref:hypothetical protein n=1 Tax=Chitinophaga polysaccharea TaxID=1293035 RepID=UPI00115A5C05|nr:hypothetical protein [Chitinophaga polysaccharea]